MASAGKKGMKEGEGNPEKAKAVASQAQGVRLAFGRSQDTLHSTGGGHRGVGTNESNLVDLVVGIRQSLEAGLSFSVNSEQRSQLRMKVHVVESVGHLYGEQWDLVISKSLKGHIPKT